MRILKATILAMHFDLCLLWIVIFTLCTKVGYAQTNINKIENSSPPVVIKQNLYQSYTYAPGSPTRYRYMHGEQGPGQGVFLADPNVWVYNTDFARRVGMPLEWASDELKGVTAVAYRMQTLGAEKECGWGGNPRACKPVVQCLIEFYFDRQLHLLPWREDVLPVDINWRDYSESSASHLHVGLKRKGGLTATGQPFADPVTGEKLYWDGMRVLAYDREFDGQFSFVRIELGCQGIVGKMPKDAVSFELKKHYFVLDDDWRKDQETKRVLKVFHAIFLPASWNARVHQLHQQNFDSDNRFYQNIWNNTIQQGLQK